MADSFRSHGRHHDYVRKLEREASRKAKSATVVAAGSACRRSSERNSYASPSITGSHLAVDAEGREQ